VDAGAPLEQEPTHLKEKLTTAVAIDSPAAAEIVVSSPDTREARYLFGIPSLLGA
jgi:hypothetical protein